ncbi:AsmA-like C-terminal region-containing protein [Candidatus Pelagibacter sp.]|nr:AsmA-like C-terminal region-containing protein [Candidatus Pelagibacter sp.]
MKKIVYRCFAVIIILIFGSIVFLSTIGVQTEIFNSKILSQIKKIDKNLDIDLKKVSVILNPFKFKINAKTVGTNINFKEKVIQLESIKLSVSIKSLIDGKFSLAGLNISTKAIEIKELISFIRMFKNNAKIYIAEQFVKNGYVIADISMEFDELGKIKSNYKINGLVKDGKINLLNKYNLDKIDFIFNIQKENFQFNDLKLSLNNKNILASQVIAKKKNDKFLVSGKINHKNITLDNKDINHLIDAGIINLNIQEINFNSENSFSFKLNNNLKVSDLNINSEININNLKLINTLELKKIFPKIKKEILLQNHVIQLDYSNDNLNISGAGEALLQEKQDKFEYKILKNKEEIKYDLNLVITKNQFKIDFLNYEKNKKSDLVINVKAKKIIKKNLIFEKISLIEKNNNISIKKLSLSNDYKINSVENVIVDFQDKNNLTNRIQIVRKDKDYIIEGDSFNINKIIKDLLNSDEKKKLDIFQDSFKLNLDVKKIFLDNKNIINNLKGYLLLKNNKISEVNLESKFSNQKNIKLTIITNGDEQVTTLISKEAKPLVDRYKFIKGFEGGELDFYSVKKNDITNSTLKIDNFKIQEIPALAKLLTLASLQGIADLLTGEGIRFTDFEMKFSTSDKLMTIEEMYAIGPAISILMDGYIENNELISIRGTLVPATTINRTISSIPILGNILVGKKVGEGVFGVSFKIKGHSKNIETTVNPIKTLTPRFITRTLEKIKRN